MMPEALDSESLYVFVFGPGFGESIAVRIPPDRWMVIDSCRVGGNAAALHVLKKYDEHHCECLVLTHRHQDHYPGFADLIDHGDWNTIGCNDLSLDHEFISARDLEARLKGELEQVIASIDTRWEKNSEAQWWTWRTDDLRPVGGATARILHPERSFAYDYDGSDNNELSCAVYLTWEGTRLLFGADVPNPHWETIHNEVADVSDHHFLKVPHHGSEEAIHRTFMKGERERIWVVTPYNRGRKLPRFDDDGAIHRMFDYVDTLYLTGLPIAHDLQNDSPLNRTRRDVLSLLSSPKTTFELPGELRGTVEPIRLDVSCYVVARFDNTGTPTIVCCGPGTVRMTENSHSPGTMTELSEKR